MDKENTIEVFAYDKYQMCEPCEKLFFKMIEEFFSENIRSEGE